MASASTATRKRSRRQARAAPAGEPGPFIWREALWGLDWLSLRLSPVYLGLGVPRGDGSPVVLVPGFLTTDAYLVEMYFWLQRIGYSPFLSGIGVNADCIQALSRRLEKTIAEAHESTGRPVRVIGHSLGGFLARMVALRRPDIITQLISLGAPIKTLQAHPAVMAAAKAVNRRSCSDEACECRADHCVPSPPPSVRRAALYSRDDGVMDWRNCLEPETSLNHEVGGTHIGLVFNARVYRVVGELLAQPTESLPEPAA